ncbi:MAG: hypothetical protein PHX15_00035 [Candidatus Nanoarchaeia archaeon]|nr:hypothetical protein [Candidatus Nanoarchaeia archaeon]MDD4563787.1 hypothetical protein [Candidatus Nanoarchaeia archaeon]
MKRSVKNNNKIDKINFFVLIFLRIVLIIAIPISVWENNFLFVFLSLLSFCLTFLPKIIERKYNIDIPSELEIIIVLFIYAGIFLGGVRDFYYRYWWWDSLLHAISGLALGFIGFLILYTLYKTNKFKASPKTIVLFTFCFALAMGTTWEIFEFGIDQIFGYNMQKARYLCSSQGYCDSRIGVIDSMVDLILDAFGALVASFAGYFYLSKGKSFLFQRFIKRFEKENKHLFNKKSFKY